jgi:hypothetical protein
MAELTTEQKLFIFRGRKRFGYSHSFGTAFFGYTRFGEFNNFAGIYQYCNSWGQRKHIKTIMHWPTNPQTIPQQAWRTSFADGMALWQALTLEEKEEYNIKAKSLHMGGHNLFLRDYLSSL